MYECNPLTPAAPIPLESFEPVAEYDAMYKLDQSSDSLPLIFKMSLTKQFAKTLFTDPDSPEETFLRVAFNLPQETVKLVNQPLLFEMITYAVVDSFVARISPHVPAFGMCIPS